MPQGPGCSNSRGAIFLSPHNDDETLFGAFTLLREQPRVVTVLRSCVQEQVGTGVTHREREAETEAALAVLGVTKWEQWPYPDSDPPWSDVEKRLASLQAEHIYAPAIERGGHPHHNVIGQLAQALWPRKVTYYTTYTTWGRTKRGCVVPWEYEWALLKLRALSCYRSQIVLPGTWTTQHFLESQIEYYARDVNAITGATYWLVDTARRLRSTLAGTSSHLGIRGAQTEDSSDSVRPPHR